MRVFARFDPLRLVKTSDMESFGRYEFYKRLALGSETASTVGYLLGCGGQADLRLPQDAIFLITIHGRAAGADTSGERNS